MRLKNLSLALLVITASLNAFAQEKAALEPKGLDKDIDFILETAGRFLTKKPNRTEVKSVLAGLRPLATPTREAKKIKEISRGHKIYTSDTGLVTITGGKWTTYRQMTEGTIDVASKVAALELKKSITRNLSLHGSKENVDLNDPLYFYGSDSEKNLDLVRSSKELATCLSKDLGIIKAQVVWAVRNEMARTLEDVLSRRTRALLLDARESARIAPELAVIMAIELEQDEVWIQNQIEEYTSLANNYLLN